MLNDRERAELREIQRRFLTEDPRFVQTFDASTRRLAPAVSAQVAQRSRVYTVLAWLAATLSVLLLVTGLVSAALLLGGVAVVIGMARGRAGAGTPGPQ